MGFSALGVLPLVSPYYAVVRQSLLYFNCRDRVQYIRIAGPKVSVPTAQSQVIYPGEAAGHDLGQGLPVRQAALGMDAVFTGRTLVNPPYPPVFAEASNIIEELVKEGYHARRCYVGCFQAPLFGGSHHDATKSRKRRYYYRTHGKRLPPPTAALGIKFIKLATTDLWNTHHFQNVFPAAEPPCSGIQGQPVHRREQRNEKSYFRTPCITTFPMHPRASSGTE